MENLPSESLAKTVFESDLADLGEDLLDSVLDSAIGEDALGHVPVVGSIVHLIRGGRAVRDVLFLRKIIQFLRGLSKASPGARRTFGDTFKSAGDKKRFGETMLLLLDRFDDTRKAELLGTLWAECASGRVDYASCNRLSYMIDKLYWPDLSLLLSIQPGVQKEQEIAESLHAAGLLSTCGIDGGTFGSQSKSGGIRYDVNKYGRMLLEHGLLKMDGLRSPS